MGVGSICQTVSRYQLAVFALLPLMLLVPACSWTDPSCPAGLHVYKSRCLSSTAIEYSGCTEDRGISSITEFGAGAGGTLRVVANASLNVAYKRAEQENTPVALQIVQDCLAIATNNASATPDELTAAVDLQTEVGQFLQQWEHEQLNNTATISLSRESVRVGEQLTVSGSQFQRDEMVAIRVHATLIAQVQADGDGAFTAVITIPTDAPPPDFGTTITASGQTSARSAQAPFRTAP